MIYRSDKTAMMIVNILEPHSSWRNEDDKIRNSQARHALKKVLYICKEIPISNKIESLFGLERYHYWQHYFIIENALMEDRYMAACHELINIFACEPFRQGRILCNIIALLETYVSYRHVRLPKIAFKEKRCTKEQYVLYSPEVGKALFDEDLSILSGRYSALTENKQRMNFLNSAISAIKLDIQCDSLSNLLYYHKSFNSEISQCLFPASVTDEKGEEVKTEMYHQWPIKICRNISANNEPYQVYPVILPHYPSHMFSKKRSMTGTFYEGLGLCYIFSPRFKINDTDIFYKGFVVGCMVDIQAILPHLYTDGAAWYNFHSKECLGDLYDYRIGLLFEITKMKRQLTSQMQQTLKAAPLPRKSIGEAKYREIREEVI